MTGGTNGLFNTWIPARHSENAYDSQTLPITQNTTVQRGGRSRRVSEMQGSTTVEFFSPPRVNLKGNLRILLSFPPQLSDLNDFLTKYMAHVYPSSVRVILSFVHRFVKYGSFIFMERIA